MPTVCRYVPNRRKRRGFTAKDAGRIICEARSNGYSEEEIVEAAGKCLEDTDKKAKECAELKSAAYQVLSALAGILLVLAVPESLILRVAAWLIEYAPKFLLSERVVKLLEALPALRQQVLEAKALLERAL